ncbi:hypothetical protein M422DRAFT_271041 [Sphaerobolus stellatus SS14]|uniref:Uncharacterized protein n=1 Tax=Sphaerobolus stellatus (strain SS14) TaxID=990650 RepID=A0A0C9UFF9_SPHS4|nr:hypothetical protein M422DRAFT_271041 [Sphaerobolus stellatus SS14]
MASANSRKRKANQVDVTAEANINDNKNDITEEHQAKKSKRGRKVKGSTQVKAKKAAQTSAETAITAPKARNSAHNAQRYCGY